MRLEAVKERWMRRTSMPEEWREGRGRRQWHPSVLSLLVLLALLATSWTAQPRLNRAAAPTARPATSQTRLARLLNAPHPCRAVDRFTYCSFHLSSSLVLSYSSVFCFSACFLLSFLSHSSSLLQLFFRFFWRVVSPSPVTINLPRALPTAVSYHSAPVNNIFASSPSIYIYIRHSLSIDQSSVKCQQRHHERYRR